MSFFNAGNNTRNLYTKNYWYLGTLFIIGWCLVFYAFIQSHVNYALPRDGGSFFVLFLVRHANWMNISLNLVCFLFVGLFLERRLGTFNLLISFICLSFVTNTAVGFFTGSAPNGMSGLVSCYYGIVYMTWIFRGISIFKERIPARILNILTLVAITFTLFIPGSASFTVRWYPAYLFYQMGDTWVVHWGHTVGLVVGLLLGLMFYLNSSFYGRKS